MNSSNASSNEKEKFKANILTDIFKNLKSIYILRKIFDNTFKKVELKIIKYNKDIQQRLDITLNNYKKYSEIEIEIIPCKEKCGKFINIKYKYQQYYHIFFDNNKEEIKRYKLIKDDKVEKITIIIDYKVKSLEKLFDKCDCIKSIYFKNFTRNNINNMSSMFSSCSSLQEINLSNFNTDNVIKMNLMFSFCSSIKEIDLSKLNTSNVTEMRSMFFGCSSLKEINLSNFDTRNLTDIRGMFFGCFSLEKINLSNFNTNKVINMKGMFLNCSSLKELNISNFNFDNVIDMNQMFLGCSDELKMKIQSQNKNIRKEAFEFQEVKRKKSY